MLCMYLAMIDEQVDKIRFEEIYYGYHKQMLVVANRVLCNMDDAEDAVQDALIRIARNMDAIRDREDWAVRGYVLTVAKNSALKVLAKNQRNRKAVDTLKVKPEKDEDVFDRVLNGMHCVMEPYPVDDYKAYNFYHAILMGNADAFCDDCANELSELLLP